MAQRRYARVDGDRHRRRRHSDDRRGRLRHELAWQVRPRAHGPLRAAAAASTPIGCRRPSRRRSSPGRHVIDNHGGAVLRDGPQPGTRPRRPRTTRRSSRSTCWSCPTLPITATPIPAPSVPREESIARSTEMIVNTAPFDVTGHPATSVPAGLVDGLPAGLMIVGRQFDDATCLRVAHAYESAVGGFPAPPGDGGALRCAARFVRFGATSGARGPVIA